MKDIDHDFIAGGRSTPLRFGVRLRNEHFFVSKWFIGYILALKTVHISLTLVPFALGLILYKIWQLYMVILLIVIAVVFMVRFLTIKQFKREYIMRAIGFHEMFAFMVVPIILFGLIGWQAALFLGVFPVIWLGVFLVIIYGRIMPTV